VSHSAKAFTPKIWPSSTLTRACIAGHLPNGRCNGFGVSPPSVHQVVLTLERAGLISRQPGSPRSIILRVRRGSAAGAWLGAAGMITRAPSRKRSVPSTTTRWAIGRADIARSDRHPIVGVDDVDVTSGCAALDGGGRHRDNIMQRLHQKLRVDELIWKQRIVSIVELRSHFHGTGGGSIWLLSLPPGRLRAF